jgi:hypothetical protein
VSERAILLHCARVYLAESIRRGRQPFAFTLLEWAGNSRRQAMRGQTLEQFTIQRYDALIAEATGVYIMPVLQGYEPSDYVEHIRQYGERLSPGAWVGVGSVCKRNGDPRAIEAVLLAIHRERPDLRLHGFGLKSTALSSPLVHELLATADSMAWSYSARKAGRNANDWREARAWADRIVNAPRQLILGVLAVAV